MILSIIFCIVLVYSMNIPHNTQKCHLMDFRREEWSICTVSSCGSDHMCWPLADPENDRWFQGHALCSLIGCQLLIDIWALVLLFLFTGFLAVIIKLHLIFVPVYFLFMFLMRHHTLRSGPIQSRLVLMEWRRACGAPGVRGASVHDPAVEVFRNGPESVCRTTAFSLRSIPADTRTQSRQHKASRDGWVSADMDGGLTSLFS